MPNPIGRTFFSDIENSLPTVSESMPFLRQFSRERLTTDGTVIDYYEQLTDGTTRLVRTVNPREQQETYTAAWLKQQEDKKKAKEAKRLSHWVVHYQRDGSVAFINSEYGYPTKRAAIDKELDTYRRAIKQDTKTINVTMDELARHRKVVQKLLAVNPETAIVVAEPASEPARRADVTGDERMRIVADEWLRRVENM